MSPLTSPHLTGSSSLSYSYHIPSSEFVVPIRMCWVKRMDFFNGVCSVCNSGVYYVNTTSVRLVTIVKKVGGGGGGANH